MGPFEDLKLFACLCVIATKLLSTMMTLWGQCCNSPKTKVNQGVQIYDSSEMEGKERKQQTNMKKTSTPSLLLLGPLKVTVFL
jgi:hypothetical protein